MRCLDVTMTLAQRHRQSLCDAARSAGPDAPTLCKGWNVRDLLVHLVVRDSRPDAALAMVVPPLATHGERVQSQLEALPFADLIERVRSGPPRWSPASMSAVDGAVNVAEFLIHREDIVRADNAVRDGTTYSPETIDAAWSLLRRGGRLFYRASPVGIVAVAPGTGRAALRRPPRGYGSVIVSGEPVELLLHAFGRRGHCGVQVLGDTRDVDAFTATFASA